MYYLNLNLIRYDSFLFDKYPKTMIRYELILYDSGSAKCPTKLSIYKVGDFWLQAYQTETNMKRDTTHEFITVSPIFYMHCYLLNSTYGN